MDIDHSDVAKNSSLAPIGIMLGAVSILVFAVMLHHPVAHGKDAAESLFSITAQTGMDHAVHGAMAAIFGLVTVAMFVFASRLGVWRFPVLLGLVSFSIALVLMVLAAMTDGFVVPAIAARCGSSPAPSCIDGAVTLLRLCSIQIAWLSRFALAAIAIAVVAWAGALLTTPAMPRWAGLSALGAGALQLVALYVLSPRLSPQSLLFALAAQAVWYLVVATLFVAGTGPFSGTPALSPHRDRRQRSEKAGGRG